MGVIRICDWSKRPMGRDEEAVRIVIDDCTYEVCEEAAQEIENRLSSDAVQAPLAPQSRPAIRSTPTPKEPIQDDPKPSNDPPGELLSLGDPTPIKIPESTKEKLPMPTQAQAERVIAESTRFPSGGLTSLTPGKHRNTAAKKLADKEALFERSFKTQKEKLQ